MRLLVEHAFADPRVLTVRAETLPSGLASQSVLLKCSFTLTGDREDPSDGTVLVFALKRMTANRIV